MLLNLQEADLGRRIYRVIPLERLLGLFVSRSNVLVKPALWEDVFENFILKSPVRLASGEVIKYNFHDRMYGQCWTLQAASDAMWRIYSPDGTGVRIRTTVKKLLEGLLAFNSGALSCASCCIGKVEYLSEMALMRIANTTFDDSGIGVTELFRSLLVKRRPFRHEAEVRLLYEELGDDAFSEDTYHYDVDPHQLIDQIMIDPRRSYAEFRVLEEVIRESTGYEGEIKRSLLYTLPKEITLDVTDVLRK